MTLLKGYSEEELKNLSLTFSVIKNNVVHNLIEDGSNQEVNSKNIVEYLKKLTEWHTYLAIKNYYDKFIEGFTYDICSLEKLKNWFSP